MNISTNDKIDLCEVVSEKIADLAQKQGYTVHPDTIFEMIFDGDYCDIFDGVLGEID